MGGNKDFIEILREIRGTAVPGESVTDGIWYELTIADIDGNPGIYGDILAKYGVIMDNSDDVQVIISNLAILTTIADNIAAVTDVASNSVRAALLEVASEPLRQSILDAEANANIAATGATDAQLKAWEAQAEKLTANSWANELTDTFVKVYISNNNGTFTETTTTEYSAKHYKNKAAAIVGGVDWAQVDNTPTTIVGYGITDAYTKTETEQLVDVGLGNYARADKYLASLDIIQAFYTNGNLTKIQYKEATDVDYEVFTYTSGALTNIAHHVGGILRGNTPIVYADGSLLSAIFAGV